MPPSPLPLRPSPPPSLQILPPEDEQSERKTNGREREEKDREGMIRGSHM